MTLTKTSQILLFLIVTKLFVTEASAHTRMKSNSQIVPRSNRDNGKAAPCGGDAKGQATVLPAGSTLTLDWEETINHPGKYEIRFSTDGADFSTLIHSEEDTKNGTADLPHQYTKTFKLPDAPCADCVIQLVQIMTDRNPPTNYYTCADVKLISSTGAATVPVTTTAKNSNIPGPRQFKIQWKKRLLP